MHNGAIRIYFRGGGGLQESRQGRAHVRPDIVKLRIKTKNLPKISRGVTTPNPPWLRHRLCTLIFSVQKCDSTYARNYSKKI